MKNVIEAAMLIACMLLFHCNLAKANSTSQGDGIFTPVTAVIASIDKTNRPFTIDVPQAEPKLAGMMASGQATGRSYVIKFSTGDVGGDCFYTGTGRYFVESTGTLTFQAIANCGALKQGYNFMVCALDENLHCREAPWWYFKDRTYAVTDKGVVVNGTTLYPWNDPTTATDKLQKMAASIKSIKDRYNNPNDPHVVHARILTCREYRPENKSYNIHEIRKIDIPSLATLSDGDVIDWNSPVGQYAKQQNNISDVANWQCWPRTQ